MHVTTFQNYLQYEKRYSPHTIHAYVRDVEMFCEYLSQEYGVTDANDLRSLHIRSWMVSLIDQGVTPRSVNRKLSSLRSWSRLLRRQGIVENNPFAKIVAPRTGKKLPEVIDASRMPALFDEVSYPEGFEGDRDRLIMELLYSCGMRRSELIELKVTDVDFSRSVIRVLGKGRKEREIPMMRSLAASIREYIESRNAMEGAGDVQNLILTEKGKPLYPKRVYNIVKKYLGAITQSSSRSPHALRHAFATHLAENGADINAIKELLGHSSLAATQVYMHTSVARLKAAYDQAHPKA